MASTVGPDSVLRLPMQTRVRRFRGKMVIANDEEAYELEAVGEFIIRLLDGKRPIKEIGGRVASDFDVSVSEAIADTVEMLVQFVEAGMVEVIS